MFLDIEKHRTISALDLAVCQSTSHKNQLNISPFNYPSINRIISQKSSLVGSLRKEYVVSCPIINPRGTKYFSSIINTKHLTGTDAKVALCMQRVERLLYPKAKEEDNALRKTIQMEMEDYKSHIALRYPKLIEIQRDYINLLQYSLNLVEDQRKKEHFQKVLLKMLGYSTFYKFYNGRFRTKQNDERDLHMLQKFYDTVQVQEGIPKIPVDIDLAKRVKGMTGYYRLVQMEHKRNECSKLFADNFSKLSDPERYDDHDMKALLSSFEKEKKETITEKISGLTEEIRNPSNLLRNHFQLHFAHIIPFPGLYCWDLALFRTLLRRDLPSDIDTTSKKTYQIIRKKMFPYRGKNDASLYSFDSDKLLSNVIKEIHRLHTKHHCSEDFIEKAVNFINITALRRSSITTHLFGFQNIMVDGAGEIKSCKKEGIKGYKEQIALSIQMVFRDAITEQASKPHKNEIESLPYMLEKPHLSVVTTSKIIHMQTPFLLSILQNLAKKLDSIEEEPLPEVMKLILIHGYLLHYLNVKKTVQLSTIKNKEEEVKKIDEIIDGAVLAIMKKIKPQRYLRKILEKLEMLSD